MAIIFQTKLKCAMNLKRNYVISLLLVFSSIFLIQIVESELGEVQATATPHDWCDLAKSVSNGSVSLSKVLYGSNVSVGLIIPNSEEQKIYSNFDNSSGAFTDGFVVEILNIIAVEAGFNWQAFILEPNDVEISTSTEWMSENLQKVDLLGDWMTDTAERRANGAVYSTNFMDASKYLVAETYTTSESAYDIIFAFADPFGGDLWGMVILGTIITAFLMFVFERGNAGGDFSDELKKSLPGLFHSCFLGFSLFTGGNPGGWNPTHFISKSCLLSWSFAVLVFCNSYTANLASFLTLSSTTTTSISSISDAVLNGYTICVPSGGSSDSYLRNRYPSLRRNQVGNAAEMYEMIRNGTCVGGVSGLPELQVELQDTKYNSPCDLEIVGQPLVNLGGSFVFQRDVTTQCTSFLAEAISLHLVQLLEDQTIPNLWLSYRERYNSANCASQSSSSSSSSALHLKDLSGVLLLHAAVCLICIILFFCSLVHRRKGGKIMDFEKTKEVKSLGKNPLSSKGKDQTRFDDCHKMNSESDQNP